MKIIKVPIRFPVVANKDNPPTSKECNTVIRPIVLPEDIPAVNKHGTLTIRPECSRQPLVEARKIANIMVATNGMSTFRVG